MKLKKALITGINGQDGSYLAELLIQRGYEVHGVIRREAMEDVENRLVNINHLLGTIHLHVAALNDHLSIYKIVADVQPDECYHLASSSFVSYSFEDESSIVSNNFTATHSLLSSIKELAPSCRVYFAGSSEMFGDVSISPQSESTPFNPRSVYGISKLAAFHLARNYRAQHKMFVTVGILYNHESPRRGFEFVTRKITSSVAKIHLGVADSLELGNIDAQRDWGYAPDYVEAMHAMLQMEVPDDFVVATGALHTVKDFLRVAFSVVGLRYEDYVRINPEYYRPGELVPLCGDSSKIKNMVNWRVSKTFDEVIKEMVLKDIELLGRKP